MLSDTKLFEKLVESLGEIELQIHHIKNDIKNQYQDDLRERIKVWYWTRGNDGDYILSDLLVAKSRLLCAIQELRSRGIDGH